MSNRRIFALILAVCLLPLGAHARASGPQSHAEAETPFLARVDAFWAWFGANERRIHRNMFDAAIVDLGASVDARVDRVSTSIGWSFGAGDRPGEHALILTPKGDRDLRLLTEVWARRAPAFEGWTIRAAAPPADLARSTFGVGHMTLDPAEARLDVVSRGGALHVGVWHPLLAEEPVATRARLARLLVSEALGEDATLAWLGSTAPLAEAPAGDEPWTLQRLQDEASALARREGWPPGPVLSEPVPVELDPPGRLGFARTGTREVVSRAPWFLREYYARRGRPKDPLRGTGAEYAAVRVPRSALSPGGGLTELVSVLEERLPSALVLGHAVDDDSYWVDLLVLDRAATIDELSQTLRATEIAQEASFEGMTRGAPEALTIR